MESEEPQPIEIDVSPPRAYVNFAGSKGGSFELALTLGYREGEAQPTVAAAVTMSWEFVPILIRLLQGALDAYQDQIGPVRDLQAEEAQKEP